MKLLLWIISSTCLLAGCAPTNISELARALGQDQASVCVSVNTIYGTLKLARTAIANGNVSCTQEGLAVKSDAQTVTVPIEVPRQTLAPVK